MTGTHPQDQEEGKQISRVRNCYTYNWSFSHKTTRKSFNPSAACFQESACELMEKENTWSTQVTWENSDWDSRSFVPLHALCVIRRKRRIIHPYVNNSCMCCLHIFRSYTLFSSYSRHESCGSGGETVQGIFLVGKGWNNVLPFLVCLSSGDRQFPQSSQIELS